MSVTIRSYPAEDSLKRLPLTLTIEMTVEEWRMVRDQLESHTWPSSDLRVHIRAALDELTEALKIYHRVPE